MTQKSRVKKAVKARKKGRGAEEGQTKRIKPRNFGKEGQMDGRGGRTEQNLIPFTKVGGVAFGRPITRHQWRENLSFFSGNKGGLWEGTMVSELNTKLSPSLCCRFMHARAMLFGHAENADQSRKTNGGKLSRPLPLSPPSASNKKEAKIDGFCRGSFPEVGKTVEERERESGGVQNCKRKTGGVGSSFVGWNGKLIGSKLERNVAAAFIEASSFFVFY